ncbi:MAG: hypothetical protein H0U21_04015, partial [Acidimicrobiia bacterium]|nr:hypothetical protein [Acidimicrobiia bacterium]
MPARRVAFVGAVAVLAALTGGPLLRIRTWWSYEDPLATDPLLVAVLALAGVVAFVAVLEDGHWRRLDRRAVAFAAALVGWLVVGTLWSLDRAETLRQALQIGAALVIGAAVALRLGLTAWRWALWCGLHVGLAWSVVAIYLHRPGTLDRRGDWAGVFFNRNSLALYAALALLVGGLLAVDLIDRRGHPIRLLALVVLGGAAIVDVRLVAGSDALTPLVALLAAALAAGSAWLA